MAVSASGQRSKDGAQRASIHLAVNADDGSSAQYHLDQPAIGRRRFDYLNARKQRRRPARAFPLVRHRPRFASLALAPPQ
jgi:hypothetical protein